MHALQAATACDPGCNRMCSGLQPYVESTCALDAATTLHSYPRQSLPTSTLTYFHPYLLLHLSLSLSLSLTPTLAPRLTQTLTRCLRCTTTAWCAALPLAYAYAYAYAYAQA